MKLLLTGDSHVVALGRALADGPATAAPVAACKLFSFPKTLESFFQVVDGQVRLTDAEAVKALRAATGMSHFADRDSKMSYGLSMAYTTSIILWSEQWRTHRPWRTCGAHHQPVSNGAIEQITLHHYRHVFAFFEALIEHRVDFFAIEAPPVRRDDKAIGKTISADAILELDRLVRGFVGVRLRALGVHTIAAPAEAIDPGSNGHGFLKPAFEERTPGDHHHANRAYGELQLAEILRWHDRLLTGGALTSPAACPPSGGAGPTAPRTQRPTITHLTHEVVMGTERICPLCESPRFKDFRGRQGVRCADCASLPRTRATWLVLRDYLRLRPGARVAHFAPEAPLAKKLHALCGDGYEPYDFDPARYQSVIPFCRIRRCDLCADLPGFTLGGYDAVIHNHVIEHLPCNYTVVLQRLQALLKPGGAQIFSVPVLAGYSKSDLGPEPTPDERSKRYGQWDHVRRFGREDHDANLGMVFGHTVAGYRLEQFVTPAELTRANIAPAQWRATGEGVFVVPSTRPEEHV